MNNYICCSSLEEYSDPKKTLRDNIEKLWQNLNGKQSIEDLVKLEDEAYKLRNTAQTLAAGLMDRANQLINDIEDLKNT